MTILPATHPAHKDHIRPVRIRCYQYNKAFLVQFESPQIQRGRADSVLIRIDFSDGTSGYGESAPRSYVTGENSDSVVQLITKTFAPILFSTPINGLDSAVTLLDDLEKACHYQGVAHYLSALGAIDIALLDALERTPQLGPESPFPVDRRQSLRFSASVPFLPLDAIRKYFPLLKTFVDISVIKILVGKDYEANHARVELLRNLAGADTELRLEFNGKLEFTDVVRNVERLMPYGISALEQPVPPGSEDQLVRLRRQFNLDLVADEALVSLADAEQLAENARYNIFNIKVSKCGGMLRSQKIADVADRHGISCQVGSHVGESEILAIAGRRLARRIAGFDCYGGGSEVLSSRLFEQRAQASVPDWPPPADMDKLTDEACRRLVSGYRLLADVQAN